MSTKLPYKPPTVTPLGPDDPRRFDPADSPSERLRAATANLTCDAVTGSGRPCKAPASLPTGRCAFHIPAALRQAEVGETPSERLRAATAKHTAHNDAIEGPAGTAERKIRGKLAAAKIGLLTVRRGLHRGDTLHEGHLLEVVDAVLAVVEEIERGKTQT